MGCNKEEDDLVYPSEVNVWRYFKESDGLASNAINTIFEDSKGNLWIGTNRGLSLWDGESFINYNRGDGLRSSDVYAVSEDRDGNIWLGTTNGLNIFLDNQWHYFTGFDGAGIYSLLEMEDEGGVLIGTGGFGTYRYDYAANAFSAFDYTPGCLACNSVNAMFQDSEQSVWIATFQGVRKVTATSVLRYESRDGLSGNIATTISEDSWNNIWVGTFEGRTISKITGDDISRVSFNNGSGQNFIFGIQEDNEGKLWVGTVDNGLFHYDGAIMKRIYEGTPGNSITALLKDSRGNLWIGTSEEGLAQYITNPHR
jgi:two-component system, sensor histidine kinase ChiS